MEDTNTSVLLVPSIHWFRLMLVRELKEVRCTGQGNVRQECDTSCSGLQYCTPTISRYFSMAWGSEGPASI